ncbi:hypothetical protein D3C86_1621850 [compost metagenome]
MLRCSIVYISHRIKVVRIQVCKTVVHNSFSGFCSITFTPVFLFEAITQFVEILMPVEGFGKEFQSRPSQAFTALLIDYSPAGNTIISILLLQHIDHFILLFDLFQRLVIDITVYIRI